MKQLARSLVVATVALLVLASVSLADDQIQEGKDALSRGDYLKAIESLREVTQKDKKNPEGFILLGTAYLKADSLDQAVSALVQARELAPNDPRVSNLLGDVYWKQKIYAAAVEQYKKAAALDSANTGLWLKIAEGTRKIRQYNEARDAYVRVLQLDSTNAVALGQLGNIYYKAKQWTNALPLYLRLEKMYPDSLPIMAAYVKVLAENQFWKDLVPVAQKVVARDPGNSEVQAILGDALVKTGQTKQAIEQLEKFNPDSLKIDDLIGLANAYKGAEQYDKAIATFRRVLQKDSSRCDVPYALGTTLMKVKQWSKAVEMFDKKIACDTASGYKFASYLNAAMSLLQMKNYKSAKSYAEKSLVYRPDNIQAWQVIAQAFGQLDHVDSEMVAYKKVIEIANSGTEAGEAGKYNAQLLEANKMIGVRLLIAATKDSVSAEPARKKKYAAATEYLKRALQLDPKNCEMLLWMAQASQNGGNKDEAKKYYCRVLEQCPKTDKAKTAQKGLESLNMKCGE